MAKDYLLCTLDQNCKSWARAYLYKIFTAVLYVRLDSRLKEKERWNQFYEYKQTTRTNTTFTSGQDLFPRVIKMINKYLTDPISNTIKAEMAECLFVNANIIEPNDKDLSCEQVQYVA
ncbi:unnamed protein product [Rhizophagus irregularis]|nr:unnamed protein product [Rhizophagus irregularis]